MVSIHMMIYRVGKEGPARSMLLICNDLNAKEFTVSHLLVEAISNVGVERNVMMSLLCMYISLL